MLLRSTCNRKCCKLQTLSWIKAMINARKKLPLTNLIRCKEDRNQSRKALPQPEGNFDIHLLQLAPTMDEPVICNDHDWHSFSASSVNVNPVTPRNPRFHLISTSKLEDTAFSHTFTR